MQALARAATCRYIEDNHGIRGVLGRYQTPRQQDYMNFI